MIWVYALAPMLPLITLRSLQKSARLLKSAGFQEKPF